MGNAPSIRELWLQEPAEPVADVSLLRARDVEAWETLFETMYPKMLAYAQRRVDSTDDARDAVSESFTRMVQGLERLDESNVEPAAWCFGILHHVVADHQRLTYRRRRPFPSEPQAFETEPVDALMLGAEHDGARAAFAQLSAKDRDLLELRVVAGLSSEQVADILDMKPGAVRMAQARALERLRAHFEAGERT
jgi:RNA polymerase sigma-70 factor (ECF subfamily)